MHILAPHSTLLFPKVSAKGCSSRTAAKFNCFFFTEQFLNPLHHLNHLHKPHLHHIQWHTSSTFPTCFSSLHHLHHLHLHHIHHPHGLYIFIYITYIIDMSNTIYTRSYTGVLTQDLISQELISRWSTCIFPNFSQGGKGNQVSSICV